MRRKQFRILVIEDNPSDSVLIQEILEEEERSPLSPVQFRVEAVNLLAKGITRLSQGQVDLVLMDLSLPDGQGLDSFVRLYSKFPEVPIVVLTGLDDEELGPRALQHGAQDYLDKSADLASDLLPHAIRFAIERNKFRLKLTKFQNSLKA